MRKILFALIMIILLICTVMVIVKGVTLGNLEIWGVQAIVEENDVIDQKNEQLSSLVSVTYPEALTTLDNSTKAMENAKSEYESKALLLGNSSYYLQTEEYEIEFLWTRIGNYANDNDVKIKIDVTNSSISGRYDLNFTVTGKYPDVTQFIYDIENDSKLGFKIEDFNMVSNEDGVQGKFACKEIKIDIKTVDSSSSADSAESTTENTTTNSTTNTTSNTTTNDTTSNTSSNTTTTNTSSNTTSANTTTNQ